MPKLKDIQISKVKPRTGLVLQGSWSSLPKSDRCQVPQFQLHMHERKMYKRTGKSSNHNLPGTYWYPPKGATTVVSLARMILFFGFGGKRPWSREMAESKTTVPSTPALTRTLTSLLSTRSERIPSIYEGDLLSKYVERRREPRMLDSAWQEMCQPLVDKRKTASYLAESSGLGVRPSIGEWILVVVESIAISSDDDNAENFWQEHLRSSVVNYFFKDWSRREEKEGRAW